MAGLDERHVRLAEAAKLRAERERLLAEAERRRWRLHRLPKLSRRLAQVTKDLIRLELEAEAAIEESKDADQDLMWWQR